MNNTIEQFIASNKANLESMGGLATQAFAGVTKLAELNMTASKAILSETMSHVQATRDAKDPQEFIALQAGLLKPMAEKSASYAKHVQTIFTDSSADFTKAVEAKTAEAQKMFSGAVDTLAKKAPAGSESAVAAFKTAMDSVQTSAKKAVEVAQSNFTAASTLATDALNKVTKTA